MSNNNIKPYWKIEAHGSILNAGRRRKSEVPLKITDQSCTKKEKKKKKKKNQYSSPQVTDFPDSRTRNPYLIDNPKQ